MEHPVMTSPLITRQLRRWSRISLPLIGVGILCLILAGLLSTISDGSLISRILIGGLGIIGTALFWSNGLILAFLSAVWLLRWARIAIME
jgi:hypothetical protein